MSLSLQHSTAVQLWRPPARSLPWLRPPGARISGFGASESSGVLRASEFRVSGFRGSGFGVQGFGVQGSGFQGLGFGVSGFRGFRVQRFQRLGV